MACGWVREPPEAPSESTARGQGVVVELGRGDQPLEASSLRGVEVKPLEKGGALVRLEVQGLVQDGVELFPAALAHRLSLRC